MRYPKLENEMKLTQYQKKVLKAVKNSEQRGNFVFNAVTGLNPISPLDKISSAMLEDGLKSVNFLNLSKALKRLVELGLVNHGIHMVDSREEWKSFKIKISSVDRYTINEEAA